MITVIQATAKIIDEDKNMVDVVVDAPGLTKIISIPKDWDNPLLRAVAIYCRTRAERYALRALPKDRFELRLELV